VREGYGRGCTWGEHLDVIGGRVMHGVVGSIIFVVIVVISIVVVNGAPCWLPACCRGAGGWSHRGLGVLLGVVWSEWLR